MTFVSHTKGMGGTLLASLPQGDEKKLALKFKPKINPLELFFGGLFSLKGCGSTVQDAYGVCTTFPQIEISGRGEISPTTLRYLERLVKKLPATICSRVKKVEFVSSDRFRELKATKGIKNARFGKLYNFLELIELWKILPAEDVLYEASTGTVFIPDLLLQYGADFTPSRYHLAMAFMLGFGMAARNEELVEELASLMTTTGERLLAGEEISKGVSKEFPILFAFYVLVGHFFKTFSQKLETMKLWINEKTPKKIVEDFPLAERLKGDGETTVYEWFRRHIFNFQEFSATPEDRELTKAHLAKMEMAFRAEGARDLPSSSPEMKIYKKIAGRITSPEEKDFEAWSAYIFASNHWLTVLAQEESSPGVESARLIFASLHYAEIAGPRVEFHLPRLIEQHLPAFMNSTRDLESSMAAWNLMEKVARHNGETYKTYWKQGGKEESLKVQLERTLFWALVGAPSPEAVSFVTAGYIGSYIYSRPPEQKEELLQLIYRGLDFCRMIQSERCLTLFEEICSTRQLEFCQ